uniref:mL63 n=1 Tax=Polytomella magna TaxID=353565 RepID=UPI002240E485|nr:Chain AI, mL63 [Polytomella magna]8APN_AI Chain AI, mL63 [Polytomella magna]8APO_AI Chain AI, mL63 [Polytomella magna]
VVFKTTGGKAWNPPGGLKPLTNTQKRSRKENLQILLRNLSVLKLAAENQPEVTVNLFSPLKFMH